MYIQYIFHFYQSGKGEDTIPFSFHWSPSATSSVATSLPALVPDNVLFTLVQPSNEDVAEHGEQMETNDSDTDIMETNDSNVDIMETYLYDIDLMGMDDEMDNKYSSENDSDRDFVNDEEMPEWKILSLSKTFLTICTK